MKNKPNSIKIVFFNLSIFIILILLFELFFGYWFKKDSFGIYIRDQRNIEKKFDIIHNNNNYKYTFKRNSLGFIGEEIDAKKIKIVFYIVKLL